MASWTTWESLKKELTLLARVFDVKQRELEESDEVKLSVFPVDRCR